MQISDLHPCVRGTWRLPVQWGIDEDSPNPCPHESSSTFPGSTFWKTAASNSLTSNASAIMCQSKSWPPKCVSPPKFFTCGKDVVRIGQVTCTSTT
jgi:hypothetical protein